MKILLSIPHDEGAVNVVMRAPAMGVLISYERLKDLGTPFLHDIQVHGRVTRTSKKEPRRRDHENLRRVNGLLARVAAAEDSL